jgi:hypothetical protein
MAKRAVLLLSVVLVSGLSGFLGGYLANSSNTPVPGAVDTVIAKRFRVIDHRGRVTAELTEKRLDLYGDDGRVRATLRLEDSDKGILGFSDARWEGRVMFGFLGTDTPSPKDDDWGLQVFAPDSRRPVVSLLTLDNGKRGALAVTGKAGRRATLVPPD